MNQLKVGVAIAWIAFAAGFFIAPQSSLAGFARAGFWLMLGIHVVECVVLYRKLEAAPGSLSGHLLQTLVFGVAHVRNLDGPAAAPAE